MIELTRLNGHLFSVNPDLIKFVEAIPDTVLSLTTGDRLIVRETTQEVVERVMQFRASLSQPEYATLNRHAITSGAA